MCAQILDMTATVTQLIRSGNNTEDQDQLNEMYIDVAALARRTRTTMEHRDVYLHHQVSILHMQLAVIRKLA